MTESVLIKIALVTLFLPLIGFIVTLLFGKRIKWLYWFENSILIITFLLAFVLAYFKLAYFTDQTIISEFQWINLGNVPILKTFTIELGIMLDNITVLMIFVVTLVSLVVHLFSVDYMKGDKRYNRYFAYLGIFTFSMLGIVLTDNLLMIYIFWELVGISSYLLIGFWYEKKTASNAAKKAFLVNRIGDIGMFLGILILFTTYNTFSFDKIFYQVSIGNLPFGTELGLTIAGILLFCGAIGKSAQFPLHVWLPDAMEGPTPVSALIHAATMVAAGVYFMIRIFPILSGDALLVIATIGAISAFIPATIAVTQNDIKKVLAYSTISQLGYMIMAIGVGAYTFAFFHLITHAFFKAALFLGSGSVIHSMHHEQDMRKMGGLRKKMPLTYVTFLIASLALSGIPLTSGFLSKDGILAGTFAFGSLTGNWWFAASGFLVAFLTAFYMFRAIILTFHGKPKNKEKYEHAKESSFLMAMPLVVLSLLSLFFWYSLNPFNPEGGKLLSSWVKPPEISVPQNARYDFMKTETEKVNEANLTEEITYSPAYTNALRTAHYPTLFTSASLALLGILFAFLIYQWKFIDPDELANKFKPAYKLSFNKWYFDEIYYATFVAGTLALSRAIAFFDNKFVDGIVNGSAFVTVKLSAFTGKFDSIVVDGFVNMTAYLSGLTGLFFRRFQTGKVQSYLMFVIFSIIILLYIFK
ncbi:MAG TPA: NADH-quinone oxidoreductase subunit L [Ignavibacteria bacterium]|nr:NADH-quinone oxidoreductase subunit L [Ignavibacteria bacterium]